MLGFRWCRIATVFFLMLIFVVGPSSASGAKKKHHRSKRTHHALKSGSSVGRRADGHVRDVHDAKRGMDIHHGVNGVRRVSSMRGDRRLVAEHGRPGFVERRYGYHGHDFYRRTYYYHGHVYDRFYRGYLYHGVSLHVYAPAYYHSVGFYGWAYHPWRTRVVYAWGWGASPWFGYYGYYFAPYPVYPGASAWLTDYAISNDLQAAYQAGVEAGATMPPPGGGAAGPMLSQDVKDQIALEVQNAINLENGEAALEAGQKEIDAGSSGIARLLSDGKPHVFLVGDALDVENEESGEDCALTEGDVLGLGVEPEFADDEKSVSMMVLASKSGNECAKSATVLVDLDDLQEMQNHLRELVDQGLDELQKQQGTGGLPAVPPAAAPAAAPLKSGFAELAPPPDPNDAAEIAAQEKEANQAEKDVTAEEKQEIGKNGKPPGDLD